MRRTLRGLGGVVAFLVIWEAAPDTHLVNPRFVPPPSVVIARLGQLLTQQPFLQAVVASVLAWVIALALAVVIAVPAGLLLGTIPVLRTASSAVIEFIRPVPTVALIPFAIFAFGTGPGTKILLATFASLWPILFNTMYALTEVDTQLVDTARSFRSSRLRVLTAVRLPSVAPFVLTGIRFSSAVSLIVVVSTEFLSSTTIGIGSYVYLKGTNSGEADVVLAGAVLAGLFGYLANAALSGVQRRWFAWSRTEVAA